MCTMYYRACAAAPAGMCGSIISYLIFPVSFAFNVSIFQKTPKSSTFDLYVGGYYRFLLFRGLHSGAGHTRRAGPGLSNYGITSPLPQTLFDGHCPHEKLYMVL